MKIYVIAGEASGDVHAANMVREIVRLRPDAEIRAWGGDRLVAEGATLVKHYRDLAFMGFLEVAMNLRTILGNIDFCKKDILAYQPDIIIFIDYPGFNMRIAEFAKQHGIKTVYYILPQVWAWKKGRIKKLARDIDQLYGILPFEKKLYDENNIPMKVVGHPMLDELENMKGGLWDKKVFFDTFKLSEKPLIAVLPGSRKQEIIKMLPTMTALAESYPSFQFVIAGATSLTDEFLNTYSSGKLQIIRGQNINLLKHAEAALVTSGTATLETALVGTPQVVCYSTSAVSYHIAKNLVDIKYISLVNLIMDEPVVTELIQNDFNLKSLQIEFEKLLPGSETRIQILNNYQRLVQKLGGPGGSAQVAEMIVESMG